MQRSERCPQHNTAPRLKACISSPWIRLQPSEWLIRGVFVVEAGKTEAAGIKVCPVTLLPRSPCVSLLFLLLNLETQYEGIGLKVADSFKQDLVKIFISDASRLAAVKS